MADLDLSIREKIGDSVSKKEIDAALMGLFPHVPDNILEPYSTMPESDDYTPEAYDEYLMAKVLLPSGGDVARAKVIGHKRDADGNPTGADIATQSWIPANTRFSSLMELPTSSQRISLLRACIHKSTVTGIPSS
jgi:hypothetical protein